MYQWLGNTLSAQNQTYCTGPYTYIDVKNPAPYDGVIKFWGVTERNGSPGANYKFKIFRDDGTNFLFISDGPTVTSTGIPQIFGVWINWRWVRKGDLIAMYVSAGGIDSGAQGTTGLYFKSGEISSDSLKSSWTAASRWMNLQSWVYKRGKIASF